MKEIYGPVRYDNVYDNVLPEPEVIAYVVKDTNDVLALIGETKQRADLDCYTDEEILNDHLVEFGNRPEGEPVIAVVQANDEYNSLRFTYINKAMFEA